MYSVMKESTLKLCFRCRKDLPLDQFYSEPRNADGLNGTCKHCVRKYKKKLWWKNVDKYHLYRKNRRLAVREKLLDEFGKACVLCGYDKCLQALEFHHRDPSKKDFSVAASDTYVTARKEALKCVVLCANCHRETHNGLASIPPQN
jgi:hypothetical protein